MNELVLLTLLEERVSVTLRKPFQDVSFELGTRAPRPGLQNAETCLPQTLNPTLRHYAPIYSTVY